MVAVDAGTVVGFASTGPCRDGNAGVGRGELYALYLDPDHWPRGIGRSLHGHALDALREARHSAAKLWVRWLGAGWCRQDRHHKRRPVSARGALLERTGMTTEPQKCVDHGCEGCVRYVRECAAGT
ncbi:MAG: GNAT family N-acetyltransferase [Haloechinothrix sp.]